MTKGRIKAFTENEIWYPTYDRASEEEQRRMRTEAAPVHIQANKFIEENDVIPLSISVVSEVSGGFQSPNKSRVTLYLLYK